MNIFVFSSIMSVSSGNLTSSELGEQSHFPSYLRILTEWRVILCIEHGSCYTQSSLPQHLLRKHRIKSRQRQEIEQHPEYQSIASTMDAVIHPIDGVAEIQGLPNTL